MTATKRLLALTRGNTGVMIPGALLLIALLSAVAYGYLKHIDDEIEHKESELLGLEYIERIRNIIKPLQEHRGILVMNGSLPSPTTERQAGRGGEIEAAFTVLREFNQSRGDPFALGAEIETLHAEWPRLHYHDAGTGIDVIFGHCTAYIGRLLALHRRVITSSGLDLDPVAETYNLVQILDVMLTFILEPTGQVRALYSGFLAAPEREDGTRDRIIGRVAVLDGAVSRIEHHASMVESFRPDLAPAIGTLPERVRSTLSGVRDLISDYPAAVESGDAPQFFTSITGIIHEGYLLHDATLEMSRAEFERQLSRARDDYRNAASLFILIFTGIVFLLVRGVIGQRERDVARRSLREQHDFTEAVMQTIGALVVVLDRRGRIVSTNRYCEQLTGFPLREIENRPFWEALLEDDEIGRVGRLFESPHSGHFPNIIEARMRTRNGTPRLISWTNTCLTGGDGAVRNVIATGVDITERKELEERTQYLAEHDFLTGLPNRLLFQDRLAQAIARAERSGERLALLFMDLDRFKEVNDTLGHEAGDTLLREIADRLRELVRTTDSVCRQGGDEFLIMLTNIGTSGDIERIARNIVDSVSRPCLANGTELRVTPSIGISIYPDDGRETEELIRNADAAMYHAKRKGRDNWQFFRRLAAGEPSAASDHDRR